jgi:hypothetical protein
MRELPRKGINEKLEPIQLSSGSKSVELIDVFRNCQSNQAVRFSSLCLLCEFRGFSNLPSLVQIEIPSSLRVIKAFDNC